jgi:hypothetical protein
MIAVRLPKELEAQLEEKNPRTPYKKIREKLGLDD